MNIPTWFKIMWWVLLLGLTSGILIYRFNTIVHGGFTLFDSLVFIVWIIIMLAPVFQEINLFGIKVKQAIKELEKEMGQVKSEVRNNVTINPMITFAPISDDKLQELEKKYSQLLDEVSVNKGLQQESELPNLEMSKENRFLLQVRFQIEIELMRIWGNIHGTFDDQGHVSLIGIWDDLIKFKKVPSELSQPLRETLVIANSGIHGFVVSEIQMNFVKRIAPQLIATLKGLN